MAVGRKLVVVTSLSISMWSGVGTAADNNSLFDLSLEELTRVQISVASRAWDADGIQPVSVTSISRRDIDLSGARQLSALLHLYVPGLFLTEDQDDLIVGFRGLSPDNNSKVMLLIDGVKQNTEWFWGPADAVLHGFDLDYIERIDVIRGPGSVVQGHGALLGVISIVTRRIPEPGKGELQVRAGEDGYRTASVNQNLQVGDWRSNIHAGVGEFDGVALPREAWAAERFDQGLFVADRGHRVQRGDYAALSLNLQYGNLAIDLSQRRQQRDLYNFYRDREEVYQELTQLGFRHSVSVADLGIFNWSLVTVRDDFDLFSHSGVAVGGTRESRDIGNFGWQQQLGAAVKLSAGTELARYEIGQRNGSGRNFIVNAVGDLNGTENLTYRYVNADEVLVRSVYLDSVIELTDAWTGFVGTRQDSHPDWGAEISPRASTIYHFAAEQYLRLSWQRGFRGAVGVHYPGGFRGDGLLSADSFDQVEDNPVMQALGFVDLPETKPEVIESTELAWTLAAASGWAAEVVLFENKVENVIDVGVYFVDPGIADIRAERIGQDRAGSWNGFFFFKNNEGEIRWRGSESRLTYQATDWSAKFSYASVQVESASSGNANSMYVAGSSRSPHAKAYPESVWRAQLRWHAMDRWALAWNSLYYGDWWSPGNRRQDGGHYATAVLAWQPSGNLDVDLVLQNVLNETAPYPMNNNVGDAQLGDGTPTYQPRSGWLSVKYRF